MSGLRVVPPAAPPLTREELMVRGGQLAGEARVAAVEAVRASMLSEFLEPSRAVTKADFRRWRARSREAITAWQKVDGMVSEILAEIERTEEALNRGKDGS